MPFPETPLLDTFNRADEGPPPQGWGTAIISGHNGMQITSNELGSSAGDGSVWWNQNFPASMEIWITVSVLMSDMGVWTNVTGEATASANGYFFRWGGSSFDLYRLDAGSYSFLTNQAGTFAAGDGIGLWNNSGTLRCYKRASGVWSQLFTQVDTTYGAGKVGLKAFGTTGRFDNFGAGVGIPIPPIRQEIMRPARSIA